MELYTNYECEGDPAYVLTENDDKFQPCRSTTGPFNLATQEYLGYNGRGQTDDVLAAIRVVNCPSPFHIPLTGLL
jgi:hypothetical protein